MEISYVDSTGALGPVSGKRPLPATLDPITGTLVKTTVTLTAASAALVAADATRKVVYVSSTKANADSAIDPTGGTCALDSGIPLSGGDTIKISGKEAQAAMTCFGTNGQKLTVFTGS